MARAQHATLTIQHVDGTESLAQIQGQVTTLGRSDACDIVLKHPNVSRLHARIELEHDRYMLIDAGSRNGTLLNGAPVAEPTMLASGDTICLGSSAIVLRFSDPDETQLLPTTASAPALAIDTAARTVQVHGQDAALSPLEYGLLEVLARNSGRACSRDECFAAVWGQPYDHATCEQALNTCLAKLRRNLRAAASAAGQEPPSITTLPRIGFRLDTPVVLSQAGPDSSSDAPG